MRATAHNIIHKPHVIDIHGLKVREARRRVERALRDAIVQKASRLRVITGRGKVIVHVGYPTESFKAPMIYNPWFEAKHIDAVVTPMGVPPADFATVMPALMRCTTVHGALITMPHKVSILSLADEVTPTAQIAGAANALVKRPDGTLLADMFDGAGFVRGVERKGKKIAGSQVLVVTFIAMLELARERLLELRQAEAFAPIYVRLAYSPA